MRHEPERAWAQAEAHALAAAALLDDPSVPPWTAAESLRRGYAALAWATQTSPVDPRATLHELATDDDASLDPATLRALSLALSNAVTAAAEARFAPTRRRDRHRRALGRAAIGLTVLAAAAAIGVATFGDWREGPWRVQYFASSNFDGPPLVERDGDVSASWGKRGPDASLPIDRFSVRYDTCMVLTETLEITFVLTSDDGARLFVDGELALDNWGVHAKRRRSADVSLGPGTHHLQVEHFDDRGVAMVELLASLHGELPDFVPVRLLRYPGDDLEAENPCAP